MSLRPVDLNSTIKSQVLRIVFLFALILTTLLSTFFIAYYTYNNEKFSNVLIENLKPQITQDLIQGDYYDIIDQFELLYESGYFSYLSISTKFGFEIASLGESKQWDQAEPIIDRTGQAWGTFKYRKQNKDIIEMAIVGILICCLLSIIFLFFLKHNLNNSLKKVFDPLSSLIGLFKNFRNIDSLGLAWNYSTTRPSFRYKEIDQLNEAIIEHLNILDQNQKQQLEKEKLKAMTQTAKMFAHDVKKPLSMVQAGTFLLKNCKSMDEYSNVARNLNDKVQSSVVSIESMLSDFMDYGSDMTITKKPSSIKELVTECLDDLKLIMSKDITISTHFAHINLAYIDPFKVKRVIGNILQNAAQAINGSEEKIWIETRQISEEILIEIGNTGSFILEEDLDNLFTAFFTKGKRKGTGLGLAISKKIVEMHGGKISVHSSQEEARVSFHFTLPVCKQDFLRERA